MNEVLDQIVKKNNIEEKFINAKAMDKENRIFKSENYVVKIYYPKKFQYYYNELEVYKNLNNKDYLPTLYYCGEEQAYKYIIISRLDGKSLFDSWDEYSKTEKIDIVKQISVILKDINNIRQEKVAFKPILDSKFQTAIFGLDYSPEYILELHNIYDDYLQYINDIEIGNLIHIDVHFYNFFVNKNKIYAYDFENMMIAPRDYQLLRWYRMWKYPETFVYPKNSLNDMQIESYNILMPNLLNNYKELSDFSNFEKRLQLYLFIYLIEEAKRCKLSEETVKRYVKDNKEIKLF